MPPVYLIDSSIYIFRYYFSDLPSHQSQSDREVSTVLSFLRWVLTFVEKHGEHDIAFFFDESLGSGFRHSIDEQYKSNRTLPDEALAYELLACKQVVQLLGFPVYASDDLEADDLIACAAHKALSLGKEPVVVTRDKDLGQVLMPDAGLFWDYGYDDPIGFDSFYREFGIAPNRMHEYLAIAGDKADSIEGIRGVGKKTVVALFEHFESWDAIKSNLDTVATLPIRGAKSLSVKLRESIELVDHNLKLTALLHRKDLSSSMSFLKKQINAQVLLTLLNEFNAPKSMKAKIK